MKALSSDPMPTTLEREGEEHVITIGTDAKVMARVIMRGRGNRLGIGAGAVIAPFAPAGFAATVPDLTPPVVHTVIIDGEDNTVVIGAGTRLGVNMTVRGKGNRVEVGEACHLHGFINVLCSGGRLAIGDGTTMVQGSIQLHEPGEIVIGRDCMISSQVYVSLSDIHPIFDLATGQRINPAASVYLGDHVWAGLRCMIMKGAKVGSGGIIAAGAIVSGDTPANAVVAGAPARVLREGVAWRRDFREEIEPTGTTASARGWRAGIARLGKRFRLGTLK
ncbi:hypothetical protein [Caulobacter segnis]|uniref:acyltransferase n=1 Tax=Caulobacter segnis TaxID=88688 RepID=UPI0028636DF2|nr:hypothetical protein [Caulobacter segnis]MDR6627994.1 acetyltransferase-like isoleucine patch superfamily enzyme [Caulobacter segnis]